MSNKLRCGIYVALSQLIVTLPLYIASLLVDELIVSQIMQVGVLALLWSAIVHTIAILSSVRHKKYYEEFAQHEEEVLIDVHYNYRRNLFTGLLFAIMRSCTAGFIIVDDYHMIALIANGVLLIADIFQFLYIRHRVNYKLLVGKKVVVSCSFKGKMGVHDLNTITAVNRQYRRKAYYSNYYYHFEDGSQFMITDEGYFPNCAIAYLRNVMDRRTYGSRYPTREYFNSRKTKFLIETGLNRAVSLVPAKDYTWLEADENLTRSVRKDSRLSLIMIFFVIGFVAIIPFGIVVANFDVGSVFKIGYWCAVLALWAWLCRDAVALLSGRVYYLEGVAVTKRETKNFNFFGKDGCTIDLEIGSGSGIKDIYCVKEDFSKIEPGVTKVTVVKAGMARPTVWFEN